MPEPSAIPVDPAVLVPAGASILDAAAWVGHVCWAELGFHEVLTRWLEDEGDAELAVELWALRAERAELAAAWHRRLPELRELPRAGFVEPSAVGEEGFAGLVELAGASRSAERASALRDALAAMQVHYTAHRTVAVGPADGPTATTLAEAVATTAGGVDRLDRWLVRCS